jgi:hypothetical protein
VTGTADESDRESVVENDDKVEAVVELTEETVDSDGEHSNSSEQQRGHAIPHEDESDDEELQDEEEARAEVPDLPDQPDPDDGLDEQPAASAAPRAARHRHGQADKPKAHREWLGSRLWVINQRKRSVWTGKRQIRTGSVADRHVAATVIDLR